MQFGVWWSGCINIVIRRNRYQETRYFVKHLGRHIAKVINDVTATFCTRRFGRGCRINSSICLIRKFWQVGDKNHPRRGFFRVLLIRAFGLAFEFSIFIAVFQPRMLTFDRDDVKQKLSVCINEIFFSMF